MGQIRRLHLKCLLNGIEECERVYKNGKWSISWEEEGRKYRMERRSNKVGSFLLCSVRILAGKVSALLLQK